MRILGLGDISQVTLRVTDSEEAGGEPSIYMFVGGAGNLDIRRLLLIKRKLNLSRDLEVKSKEF